TSSQSQVTSSLWNHGVAHRDPIDDRLGFADLDRMGVGTVVVRIGLGVGNQPRRRVAMRTAATTTCISASVTLADIVVPATRGKLKEMTRAAIETAVQIVMARDEIFSSATSRPRPADEPIKLAIITSPIPMFWASAFPNRVAR